MLLHRPALASFLFEHARDIVLVIHAESGQILDANLAATESYQYAHAELCAKTIFDLRVADPMPVAQQMERARTWGVLFETLHQRRDGTTFPVEVSSSGITLDTTRVLLSVIRDITTRRELEDERETLITTTTRALAMRDEFLVVASHELRAPITNVSLQLQHLQRTLARSGGDADAIDAALSETARLAKLVDALLDVQRVDAGIVLERTDVDLAELVHGVADRLRSRAALAQSEVLVAVASVRGHWDRLRLDQILTNLVVNAIKYGRGKPIHLCGTHADDRVHIEVRDQGIGIRDEDRARIFEKYERGVSPAYGGLGLGLYITRQLVEAHGGTIDVIGNPGAGSTFQVTLPIH